MYKFKIYFSVLALCLLHFISFGSLCFHFHSSNVFSNFSCDFFLVYCLFYSVLFNFLLFLNCPIFLLLLFPLLSDKITLYDLSLLIFIMEKDYCDIEWFALETNRDHSVVFEIASKYCISDCFVDHDGYTKGLLLRDSCPL